MTNMPPGKIKNIITEIIDEDPARNTSMIARELSIPELNVVQSLPKEMVCLVGPEHFDAITEEIDKWGELTIIIQTDSIIFEVKSALPRGGYAKGYYNIIGHKAPAGGHFRVDHLKAIAFVDKPFMGMRTLSVQFYNLAGNSMLKIFLSRDGKRNILDEQLKFYEALRRKICGDA